MQTLYLYKYRGQPNAIQKKISLWQAGRVNLQGNFLKPSEFSYFTPVIRVRLEGMNGREREFNYAQIYLPNVSYTQNYYFITDIISLGNNVWELHLKLDVLYTYYFFIGKLTGTIFRSETPNNNYLSNSENIYDVRKQIEKIDFSVTNPFVNNSDNMVMITAKGNI